VYFNGKPVRSGRESVMMIEIASGLAKSCCRKKGDHVGDVFARDENIDVSDWNSWSRSTDCSDSALEDDYREAQSLCDNSQLASVDARAKRALRFRCRNLSQYIQSRRIDVRCCVVLRDAVEKNYRAALERKKKPPRLERYSLDLRDVVI
jgi:hypothetical protein